MDADLVFAVLGAFERESVRYKVIGGVAMNLVGLPRATQDLDIFVAADEDNIGRLRNALTSVFHDPDIATWSPSDSARIKQITLLKRQPKKEPAQKE